MNVFDIIGPVMIGPSSSHTAGAVRLGGVARKLLGEKPQSVVIKFHGSFAKTYRGHGTDKAVLAGLLGMATDDPGIRDSFGIARQNGLHYEFLKVDLKDMHPNTVIIEAVGKSGKKVEVLGSSVGGGNILIKRINGLDVEFTGQYNTLVIPHHDEPGAVAAVAGLLAQKLINIAHMSVYRSLRGGNAMMIIETDQHVDKEILEAASKLRGILGITGLEPIK